MLVDRLEDIKAQLAKLESEIEEIINTTEQDDKLIIGMEDEEGDTHYGELLTCFTVDNRGDYCAMLMQDEETIELYRYTSTDNGDGTVTIELDNILSSMEYEDAKEAFIKLASSDT